MHGGQIQYESGGQRDNIGFWTDPADWADWEFAVTTPGKFELTAEIAALDRSAVEVSIGSQKTQSETPATGDYTKFETVKLGILEIPSSGKTILAIHAVSSGWHPVNVKSVRLQPAGSKN
jgi:hypothetical protein